MGAAQDRSAPRLRSTQVVAIIYLTTMILTILDTTIVTVTLEPLGRQFDVTLSSAQWVATGYLLSLAVWMPASGWFGERFGTKRVFVVAVTVFTVASGLCAAAQTLPQLIAFRVLQGAGGGLLAPVGLTMLYRAYPLERRAALARMLLIPTAIAPAVGPPLGGWLIDVATWRWVFLVNVPIGAAAVAFGASKLREHRQPTSPRSFDAIGFALTAASLTSLLLAVTEGAEHGWGRPVVLVSIPIAIVSCVALVTVERRRPDPMLRLHLLDDRLFRTTNLVSMFATGTFTGVIFVVPAMVLTVRDSSAFASGLATAPQALGVMTFSQVASWVYVRVGPSRLMTVALVSMSTVLVVMSLVDPSTSGGWIYAQMFLLGGFYSCVFVALQASSFASISREDTGHASALYNTQRQVAAALGVATLATALSALLPASGSIDGIETAYRQVFAIAAAIIAVGALVARRVPDGDAAATMRLRTP